MGYYININTEKEKVIMKSVKELSTETKILNRLKKTSSMFRNG